MKVFLKYEKYFRRMNWFFFKSGIIVLAFQHFLAMVPATILVPILINNAIGSTVINISLVLFTTGIGTISFLLISKGTIPAYTGSSFAYIGLTIYLIQKQIDVNTPPELAYTYVGWAYIFSGFILILLSLLYKKKGIEKIFSFLLPPSVIGPAISLIGLELASTAIMDSGFDVTNGVVDINSAIVAIITLFIIILFSLLRYRIGKHAAIIIGMLFGYFIYILKNGLPELNIQNIPLLTIPKFHILLLPPLSHLFGLFISVIPATFIVFTENIGRVTVINCMVNNEQYEGGLFNSSSIKILKKALFSHGISTIIATSIGGVPNTIYAENIAVMGIYKSNVKYNDPDIFIEKLTSPFSYFPYILAAIISILFSCIGILQNILINIPKPVIGGMELFLFGIISAPGIQLLVEQHVNYQKISNQIITAAVLISGISGLSINMSIVELKGMSLGFVVGVVLNFLVQILKWFGNISDSITFEETVMICLETLFYQHSEMKILEIQTNEADNNYININNLFLNSCPVSKLYNTLNTNIADFENENNPIKISFNFLENIFKHSSCIVFGIEFHNGIIKKLIVIRQTINGIFIDFSKIALEEKIIMKYLNDYPESINEYNDYLCINITKNIPIRKIQSLIQSISTKLT